MHILTRKASVFMAWFHVETTTCRSPAKGLRNDLLFAVPKVISGLNVVQKDILFDPIPVFAFCMGGITTLPHEIANFVKQFGSNKIFDGRSFVVPDESR